MQSMTGYGKAEYAENGITLTVEVKTVNNRYLDIIPKYPRCFVFLDDVIRKTVQSKLLRGRVELFVSCDNTSDDGKTLITDEGLAAFFLARAQKPFRKIRSRKRSDGYRAYAVARRVG